MSKRLFLLFIAGCMAMIYSCEYEPKEVYERKTIENPDDPIVESVNLDLEADTIYMHYTQYFMYDFSSNNRIHTVRFTLDGEEQYKGSSLCNSFYISGGLSSNGTHTMVAEVFVGSGSNSIADVAGAEGYVMTKTWILKMDNKYGSQTDAKAIDGYLNITWPTYLGDDFVDYSVYRAINTEPGLYLLTRQTTEGYIDRGYVGEGGRYYVKVNRKQQGELAWGEIYLQREIPPTRLMVGEDNQYYFAWNKSKYYRAVGTYKVVDAKNYSGSNVVKTTQDPNDTTYHITSVLFGGRVHYNLQLVPGANNPCYTPEVSYSYSSHNNWGTLGYPLKSSNGGNLYTFRQVNADEFVYVQNHDTIIRYSTTLKKKVEMKSVLYCPGSYNMSLSVTSGHDYLSLYYLCDQTLKLLNPANFNESVTYNISQFSTLNGEPVISDNSLLVANKGYTSTVYDLKSRQILGTYNSQHSGYPSKCSSISSDGKYLFLTDNSFRLLKFEAAKFTQVWVNPVPTHNPPKYAEFHALNPEQLAYWDGQTFYIKQCSDFSTVYNFPLTERSILNIDYYNGKMLCYSPGHMMIRSLLNGDLIKDIPVNLVADAYTERCYLFNSVIVCEEGLMYFLD